MYPILLFPINAIPTRLPSFNFVLHVQFFQAADKHKYIFYQGIQC